MMLTKYMTPPQFWGSAEPIVVTSVPADEKSLTTGLKGIHRVQFEGIRARSEGGALFSVRCQQHTNPGALSGIMLKDVDITIDHFGNVSRPQHDYRPMSSVCGPEIIPAPVDGLYFEHVSEILLSNVSVSFTGHQPTWSMQCINGTQRFQVPNKGVPMQECFCTIVMATTPKPRTYGKVKQRHQNPCELFVKVCKYQCCMIIACSQKLAYGKFGVSAILP